MKPHLLTNETLTVFLLMLGAGSVLFYLYLYRQESKNAQKLTPGKLWSMRLLRVLAALMVLLALARPAVTLVKEDERPPVVAFLVDESLSMGFPEDPANVLAQELSRDDRGRYNAAQKGIEKLLAPLSLTHDVKVYTFSDTSKLMKTVPKRENEEQPLMPVSEVFANQPKPTGEYSNVGDGISDVMRDLSANKISGLIVCSDFRQTGGTPLKDVSARAKDNGIPVHSIVFGTEFPLRDLRIDEVIVPAEASLGDVLTFTLKVTNQISAGLRVKLTLDEFDTKTDKYAQRGIRTLTLNRGQNTVTIATIPNVEGIRKFKLELPVQPDEVDKDNNVQIVHVEVVKRTIRTLLIAGQPTLEYFYMVPALLRDPVVELSCWLQSADVDYTQQGNKPLKKEKLPETLQEWQEFDVVMLYDADPNHITPQQIGHIEDMVSKGGGLMVIGGRSQGLAKFLQVHATKMRQLLPVDIDNNQYPILDKHFSEPFTIERTPQAKNHPILAASTDEKLNEELWKTFPKFYWHHPVKSAKPKALVMLERTSGPNDDRGTVVMALMRYNNGSVFYSGINELWRWRYPYESYDYDRLWTRIIRYLGEAKLHGTQQNVALSTDRRTYAPGEDVALTLRVLDYALWQQLANQPVYVKITTPEGAESMVPMKPDTGGVPTYRGIYKAKQVGSMLAHAKQMPPDATTEAQPLFEVKHTFAVKMQSLEYVDTSSDLDAAQLISDDTGGKCYTYKNMRDLEQLAKEIPAEPQVLSTEEQVELWDRLGYLIMFLVFVATEWCLRKLWGLL